MITSNNTIVDLKLPGVIESRTAIERVGLIGVGGSGKTSMALTFPNPLVGDADRKCPDGTLTIPFGDPSWVNRTTGESNPAVPNIHEAVLRWILANIQKLSEHQTFILDSITIIDGNIDAWVESQIAAGRKPFANNKFAKWDHKLKYYHNLFEALKRAPCNVVVTFHEAPEYNSEGDPTGALKPICTGGFKDRFNNYLTVFLRLEKKVLANKSVARACCVVPTQTWLPILPHDRYVVPAGTTHIKPTYQALQELRVNKTTE